MEYQRYLEEDMMYILTVNDSEAPELAVWEFPIKRLAYKKMQEQHKHCLINAIRLKDTDNVDDDLETDTSAQVNIQYFDSKTRTVLWKILEA